MSREQAIYVNRRNYWYTQIWQLVFYTLYSINWNDNIMQHHIPVESIDIYKPSNRYLLSHERVLWLANELDAQLLKTRIIVTTSDVNISHRSKQSQNNSTCINMTTNIFVIILKSPDNIMIQNRWNTNKISCGTIFKRFSRSLWGGQETSLW